MLQLITFFEEELKRSKINTTHETFWNTFKKQI